MRDIKEFEDITDRIHTIIRTVKDIDYECPKCHNTIICYDVDLGEYHKNQCHKCGYNVQFFVNDF